MIGSSHLTHGTVWTAMIAIGVVFVITGAFIAKPFVGWTGTLPALFIAGGLATMVGYAFTSSD
jgi:hypothetical protein